MKTHNFSPSCTTMIVGKRASADRSVIVAHSDDDIGDERVILVPGGPSQSRSRPVYYDDTSLGHKPEYNPSATRRYVGRSRGPGYDTAPDDPEQWSRPLGSIPQVAETFAYLDSAYGIMNEHKLMIGECTCGAKFHPEPAPGQRIFYSAELARVALERHTRAREAVKLIGQLIDEYGFYGTGETLLVGDGEEGWVVEMCGYPGAVGTAFDGNSFGGGLWVAQRVPHDEYFVAANQFRIRDIYERPEDRPADAYEQLHCKNLFKICRAQGWMAGGAAPLDWAATVSWGEYNHPYYSLRRVWRALSRVKPTVIYSAWVDDAYTREYPFSVKPDHELSVFDVAALYRDHYEGTEFDLTQGVAAGPYGNPNRYEKNPDQGDTFNLNEYQPEGAWERPISIYRCGMLWINQAGGHAPLGGVTWIGLERPAGNCLMPIFANSAKLPRALETMDITEFDRTSAWWAFNFVATYATLQYCFMMKDVRALQAKLEAEHAQRLATLAASGDHSPETLSKFMNELVTECVARWWRLSDTLVVKYNAGCLTEGDVIMKQLGYPTRTWLEQVGYFDGPTRY